MQTIGRKYPYCGYGGMFWRWMFSDDPKPYNSFGNGSPITIRKASKARKADEDRGSISENKIK